MNNMIFLDFMTQFRKRETNPQLSDRKSNTLTTILSFSPPLSHQLEISEMFTRLAMYFGMKKRRLGPEKK